MHALGRDEELRIPLIPVRVLELDLRDGRAAPRLVDDGLHDALDVALPASGEKTRDRRALYNSLRRSLLDTGLEPVTYCV